MKWFREKWLENVLCLHIYLLHCKTLLDLSCDLQCLLNLITFLSKKYMLILWSSSHVPTLNMCLAQVANLLRTEKNLYMTKQTGWIFAPLWELF